jgi:hypothetical protein
MVRPFAGAHINRALCVRECVYACVCMLVLCVCVCVCVCVVCV